MARTIEIPEDGGLAELLAMPFAPGDAPFRIKGNAYRGHMTYLESQVPGGVEAQAAALRSLSATHGEAWVSFFEQKFLASAWYDVFPLAIAGAACAQVTGEEFVAFVYRRTCWQGRDDIGGIHRFLLKFVSARAISTRVPGLVTRYFDFLSTEASVDDAGRVTSSVAGVPVALIPWLMTVVEAYLTTVVEIAGKRTPRVTPGTLVDAGMKDGIPVCTAHALVELDVDTDADTASQPAWHRASLPRQPSAPRDSVALRRPPPSSQSRIPWPPEDD